jgi:NMD protein affecting ribosome stability and mRNA decay
MAPIFTDNVRGRCYKCAREVQHRPHVPPSAQCICVDCYVAARKPDDVELVTPTTVLEILATRSDDES